MTRRRAYVDEEEWLPEERQTIQVHERAEEPEPSGLYDRYGNPLYRVRPRIAMGFDLTPQRKRRRKR